MRSALRRVPVQTPFVSSSKTFPAPVRGQIANENESMAQPGGAKIVDNWMPTSRGLQLRGGSVRRATIPDHCHSLFSHEAAGVSKLFAATNTSIYDVTTPADPMVPPAALVTGRSSGLYATARMNTTGGNYTIAVNGADDMLLYDGSTFTEINGASTPAITGVETSTFSHVWVYRNRLFFVEMGTSKAWYLPIDSIGGTATAFPLIGEFPLGGDLMFGGRWSLDAGDGLDDKCVFVSTNGDVVIYEGGDPSDAADWRKVGNYQVGRPLGINAWTHAGGDLLIATESGLVPISAAINKDRAVLSLAGPSNPITPEWLSDVRAAGGPWSCARWDRNKLLAVAYPAAPGKVPHIRVLHLETGAWGRLVGWDAQCMTEFRGDLYFGRDGRVMQAGYGSTDDGAPYICTLVLQFDHFDAPGPVKTLQMARASFFASVPFRPKISASANYSVRLPAAPAAIEDPTLASLWDVGLWDVALWDDGLARNISSKWVSIGVTGHVLALQIQVTCSGTKTPDAELVSIDTTYATGALVV